MKKIITQLTSSGILSVLCVLMYFNSSAQVYLHDFGTTPITEYPYTAAPAVVDPNISNSSWENNLGIWVSYTGQSGQGLGHPSATEGATLTLTFTVAAGKQLAVNSFNFWRQRSPVGAQNWSMTIAGINVGSGTIPTTGSMIGTTNVANPVQNLTGLVTVEITLSNPLGSGSFTLDNFRLNGSVTDIPLPCTPPVVTSTSPLSGPPGTVVTIEGSGFEAGTGTSEVTFNGLAAGGFTVISDTELKAVAPLGTGSGNIIITTNDCDADAGVFTFFTSDCPDLGTATDVFISELYDHVPGSYGMIELYNPTANTIVFGGQYILERYGNIGDLIPSATEILPGSIAPYSTYLVISNFGDTPGCSNVPDHQIGTGINANDEIKIRKNGVIIDIARAPNTVGYTVIRDADASAPTTSYDPNDWQFTANDCADLGMHTALQSSVITVEPTSASICENESVSFSVEINTLSGFSYQWKMLDDTDTWVDVEDGPNFSGSDTPTLTIVNAPIELNQSQYYCEISSADCTLISFAAQLTVSPLPVAIVIATQPTCTNPTGSLNITASIGDDLTYSLDGVNYQMQTTFTGIAPGTYSLYIQSSAGCIATTPVIINPVPNPPPVATVSVTPPSCANPNGVIEVTSPVDVGVQYTYSINAIDFQISPVFDDVPAGTYIVTVITDEGCVSVTPPFEILPDPAAPPVATTTVTQPGCGETTGTIQVTAPTQAGITYSINGTDFQSDPVFSGLTPGNYTITVQNSVGCISVTSSLGINPPPPSPAVATTTVTQPTCTEPTGSIEVNAPVGATFEYSINGVDFQLANTFNNLMPGDYTVTVRNDDDCTSEAMVTISPFVDSPAVATADVTQPGCGETSGTIEVTSPLGAGLTYSINGVDFQSATTFSSLSAGAYTLTVQNTNGCISETPSIIINAAPTIPAVATTITTQPTCTTPTGTIEVTAPTGTGLEYSINGTDFQSSTTFSGVASGTYNVTVQNADGCTSQTAQITIDPAPASPAVATADVTQPTCTTPSGTIEVTSPLGAGLEYSINGVDFQTGTTFSGLTPGAYTLTVQNAGGCISQTASIIINTVPTAPAVAVATATQPLCGDTTGTIEVTAPVGTGLQYSINGTDFQTGTTFNAAPGIYTITVQNAGGCTSVTPASVVIDPIPASPAVATTTVTQASCTTATGTIEVTAPTGTGLEYSINGTDFQTGTTFNNVAPGTYNVIVQNAGGCTSVTADIVIDPAPVAPAVATTTVTQPDCDETTGTIVVTAPVGAGLEYSINGTDFQTGTTFNPAPGTYTITVQNADGCTSETGTITIDPAPASPAVATTTVTQPTCNETTGTIEVTAPVGAGLEYSINGTDFQTGTTFNNVAPGTYTVTTQNANGCTSETAQIVIDPAPVAPAVATTTVTQPDCDETTGTIEVTAPVGAGLEYSINGTDFQTGTTFNPAPGTYTITVQNADGCTSETGTITIDPAPASPAVATTTVTQPTCNETTGTIEVTAPVGAGLEYSINGTDFQTGTTFNPAPGTYAITVQSANGCTSETAQIVIDAPTGAPAVATTTVTQPTCTTPATIQVTAPTGAGLEYSIDGTTFQTATTFTVSPNQTYTVTVRNADGCTSETAPITIDALPQGPDVATTTVSQPTCTTTSGTIQVTAPTGAGLTYSVDGVTFQSSTSFEGLAPGTYTVTVQNADGCTSVTTPILIDDIPVPDVPTIIETQPTCDVQTGTIEVVTPTGAGFTYSIDGTNFQPNRFFTNLAPGIYTVTVTSPEGCSAQSETISIDDVPTPPTITGVQGCNETAFGRNYILDAVVSGDSFDENTATFEWTNSNNVEIGNNQNSFDVTQYATNNNIQFSDFPIDINLTVTTPQGCVSTYTFTVESTFCMIPRGISPNNDGDNDSFDLTGFNAKRVVIFNRYGKEVYSRNDYVNEWVGQTDDGDELPTGTYFYVVETNNDSTTGWVYINRQDN